MQSLPNLPVVPIVAILTNRSTFLFFFSFPHRASPPKTSQAIKDDRQNPQSPFMMRRLSQAKMFGGNP